ncbi:helix-turn-helix domain-containing protein [Tenacibaculum maritimum]|nr:helix-turn-helix domain-containing protein [Tenacibaculum maritimum]MDB0613801.1 helix-turn-helix domain-containing protein [Tenacibaculum maritimum]
MSNLEIKKIRKEMNLNQKEFAKMLGVGERAVQTWESGERNISQSAELLLKMILDKNEQSAVLNNTIKKTGFPMEGDLKQIPVRYMKVPFVPIKAQAGFPSSFGDELYMSELDTVLWEIEDKEYKGSYIVFEVAGDSMDDGSKKSLESGDKILCREVSRHLWQYKLHYNDWYFVLSHPEMGITVKRITDHNVDTGVIKCHSLNPYYEDFELNLNELSAIFNVVDIKRSARL